MSVEIPEAKENVQSSVAFSEALKSATIQKFLKEYGRYLLKNGKVDNVEAVKAKLNEIVSMAMDRGDATAATLERLNTYFDENGVETQRMRNKKKLNKFYTDVLCDEMNNIAPNCENFTDVEKADFCELVEKLTLANNTMKTFINKYSDDAGGVVQNFISAYGKMFDDEFVAKFQED